jgi:hypothetical protein
MSNDIIESLERRVRRLRRLAIAGWAAFALLVELPKQRALVEARASIKRAFEERKAALDSELKALEDEREARTKRMDLHLKLRETFVQQTMLLTAFVKKLGGRVEQKDGHIVAIDLRNTKLTDSDLEGLFELPSLKTVNLKGTRVTDAGVKKLKAKLPGLTVVR